MGNTKKVDSTGRLGSRYGVGIRKRLLKTELKQKQKTTCPKCHSGKLKRIDRGIFVCKKCSAKIAGGTFIPQTLTGGIIKKMVSQKKFLGYAKELIEAKEEKTQENEQEEKPKEEKNV
jgi:large subunit ribosomal protein L37Ae